MTRLPFEILLMIFEKIGFIDLIKLRSICKDWKSIIDNNKIMKELTIDDTYYKFKISMNSKPIIFLDQFKLDGYQIFRKIISSNILRNLKYLNYFFKSNEEYKCKLINLNCFKLLEHLVLGIDLREEYQNFILVHPNIKCLSVSIWDDMSENDLVMEINCPKCEKLEIGGDYKLSHYDIIYPERVKIFSLAIYDYDENEYEIDKFINIETLEIGTEYFHSNNGICSKIDKFTKLKKIAVEFDNFKNFFDDTFYVVKNIRRLFYDLIDHDLISKKRIQLFLNNEEIKSKKQIKKLIDKEIGCSLDFIIWEEEHNPNDSDYLYELMEFRGNSSDSENN